ncbi:MAG: TlyA family RNA methyltransferase [Elusimicrobia bacterium]|nr:TlyA family RNA methyltransferase [Elusimicrobiota bacterium]
MKKRLDLILVERGIFPTRAKAQAAVMAGAVLVDGTPETKAGAPVPDEADIEILTPCPFVSRGGLKLQAALEAFPIRISGRICLDVGASTGGFTDCLLQKGAAKVYAVDVGRGQLDAKLRSDPRVVCREKTHARDLSADQFDPKPDLAVIDVSFISLTKVLPHIIACLARPFDIVALVKPQFELGPKEAPKGVVRTEEKRLKAVAVVAAVLPSLGLSQTGLLACPVHGPKGNVEYFLRLVPKGPAHPLNSPRGES